VSHAFVVRHETFPARLAGAGWAVWFYLEKCIWPQNLIFMYPKWHINPKDPLCYVPAMLVLAMFGIGWLNRRGWGKAWLFGFGYFIALLLPVLGLVDISFMRATLVADHWQYFAMIGPAALAAASLVMLFAHCARFLRLVLGAFLLAVLGMLTWQQSRIYANPYTFWQATVDRNPGSFVAQSGLGNSLFEKGRVEEAIAHYQRALDLEPSYFDAHYDLGNIFLQEGQPVEAIFHYQKALETQPNQAQALNNLAWILATCPDHAFRNGIKAVELAKQADASAGGKDPAIVGTLAAAQAEAGQFPAAISAAQRALQLAASLNKTNLARELQLELELYQRGVPFRDSSQSATSPGVR